jgi:flagellar biosynthesis component FlhA
MDPAQAKAGEGIQEAGFKKALENLYRNFGIDVQVVVESGPSEVFITAANKAVYFPSSLAGEVRQYLSAINNSTSEEQFTALIVPQIFWQQPCTFFTPEICRAYLGEPSVSDTWNQSFDEAGTITIIHSLLEMKLLPASKAELIQLLNNAPTDSSLDIEGFTESLIDQLSAGHIEIKINSSYFNDLLLDSQNNQQFIWLRNGLFNETGLEYPEFTFLPDSTLPPFSFYFSYNVYAAIPIPGIKKGYCLVSENFEFLKELKIEDAQPRINPHNLKDHTIIPASEKVKAENAGLTTWGIQEYFILCLNIFLRKHGYCFINRTFTSTRVGKMKLLYPELTRLFNDCVNLNMCTHVIRSLVQEGIPIRNMKLMMELMIEADYIDTEDTKFIIFDNRYAWPGSSLHNKPINRLMLTGFVRSGMKRIISNYYLKGQSTLTVFLIAPEIEALLLKGVLEEKEVDDADAITILKAIQVEFEHLTASYQKIILTSQSIRMTLKKIIEASYPEVSVIAYQELSPETNIQPIGRISM